MDADLKAEEHVLRRAALGGDENAWRVLHGRNIGWLYHYLKYRTHGDGPAAEDLAQETWEVAVRSLKRFEPDRGPFRAWLKGIADNLVLNARRKAARRSRLGEHAHEILPGVAAPAAGLDDGVMAALSALPQRYRLALLARYREQRSVEEIAREWGESYKSVESVLSRARAAFRTAYRELTGE